MSDKSLEELAVPINQPGIPRDEQQYCVHSTRRTRRICSGLLCLGHLPVDRKGIARDIEDGKHAPCGHYRRHFDPLLRRISSISSESRQGSLQSLLSKKSKHANHGGGHREKHHGTERTV